MCPHEPTGRLLDYVSNYVTRWMVIRSQERQNPAYRATLLYFYLVMPAVVQDIRKYLVEVFALVRVNLRILKGKIAGKRACWRTNLENFKLQRPFRLL